MIKNCHRIHDAVTWWAARRPGAPAIINHDRKQVLDWAGFDHNSTALAGQLLRMGFRKGDFLATSLPLSIDHILLEYACFKIGVIHAPLDLRLRPPEVQRCLGLIRPREFIDAQSLQRLSTEAEAAPDTAYEEAAAAVLETDPAQVIFTTGSTGPPKPALLSHRGITCQNRCLGAAFGFDEGTRMLVNLPPSHVGCQAEILMTTLFCGGTAVTLEMFDAARSLEAIQEHRVNLLGQIPAMFNFEWRLPQYAGCDLSSLERVVYGGQQVSRHFLERLATMAPRIGTGLGLTEASGFCTYTAPDAGIQEVESSIGYAAPAYPLSIREPMREDGRAGNELPDPQMGHICFRGPQTFLGYVNDPEATAKAVSTDGFLYTGDMGFQDSQGLHLAGRAKWIMKPAGYQVFPGEVENHFCALEDKVAACGAVGVEHALLSEAIVAFIEKKPGADITIAELKRHARSLASYQRPLRYVLLDPGRMPLNRAIKIDYLRLQEMAAEEIRGLREKGRWDGSAS